MIDQPLVIALSMWFWIFYDEVSVLNADRIIEPPHSSGAAPEVSELPVTFQIDRVPDDMIVDVSTDDESIVPFGKSPGKLLANETEQPL